MHLAFTKFIKGSAYKKSMVYLRAKSFKRKNDPKTTHILLSRRSNKIQKQSSTKSNPIPRNSRHHTKRLHRTRQTQRINHQVSFHAKPRYMRFFMLTIRNNGKSGLTKEEASKPRIYNLVYPPTTLDYLSKYNLKIKLLEKPVSEDQFPMIGHLMRLSRYNYFVYLTLSNLLK